MPINSFFNYHLSWKPDKEKLTHPLFQSLADELEKDISSGTLAPGTLLPPQRELADYLDLNFTTITRAYNLCREKGLIYGVVGKGTFVSPHAAQVLTITDHPDERAVIRMGYISSFESCNRVVADAIRRVTERAYLTDLLDYRHMQGHPHHIVAAQKWLSFCGMDVDYDHIAIVSGNMNGLSIILANLFKPGDAIAVDEYTYPNFMELARIFHISLLPVCQDHAGMSADHLEAICMQKEVKGVYLMPNCCNPTTVCITLERRKALADIVRRYGLIVIEDDIYDELSDTRLASMYDLIPEQTVYLSGTSKALCTGLRVSFLAFGEQFRKKIRYGIYNMNMKTSSLDVEIIAELIYSGDAFSLAKEKHELALQYNDVFDKIFLQETERHLRISLSSCGSLENLKKGLEIIKDYRE